MQMDTLTSTDIYDEEFSPDKPLLGSIQGEGTKKVEKPPIPTHRLILMLALNFAMNLVSNAMVTIVIPFEIKNLFPEKPAQTLGIISAMVGIITLFGPFVGIYSDRRMWALGRRRPLIILGTLILVGGLIIMYFGSSAGPLHSVGWLWVIGFYTMQLGYLLANTTFNALIPDLVPSDRTGFASAIYGIYSITGSAFGYLSSGILFPLSKSGVMYIIYAIACFIAALVTVIFAKEQPLLEPPTTRWQDEVKRVVSALKFSNFRLIWLGRIFYNISLAPQAFLQYMISDLTNSKKPVFDLVILALITQACGLVCMLPAGKLADKFGKKPFIYASTFIQVIVNVIFLSSGEIALYWVAGGIFGIGQACYIVVDLALAIDNLPNPEDSAKDMGLWGVTTSIGNVIGLYLFGPILQGVGGTSVEGHYKEIGYVTIYGMGSVFMIIGAVLIAFIKSKSTK